MNNLPDNIEELDVELTAFASSDIGTILEFYVNAERILETVEDAKIIKELRGLDFEPFVINEDELVLAMGAGGSRLLYVAAIDLDQVPFFYELDLTPLYESAKETYLVNK